TVVWTPQSFSDSLLSGDAALHLLRIENYGDRDLTFSANIQLVDGNAAAQDPLVDPEQVEPDTGPGKLDAARSGIRSAPASARPAVTYNAIYVHDGSGDEVNLAAGWLSVTPQAGTIPVGGFADLSVGVNSSGLIGGNYKASIRINTNDPAHGLIQVPASL